MPTRRYLKRQHAKTCNCLDEYRACLTQALAAYQGRKNPETDVWLEDVLQSIDAQKARMPRRHKQQLPIVPTCTEETEWQRWTAQCAKEKVLAKEECKKLKAEPSKNVEQAKVSKFKKGYWQRQKQCNKQILGKSSKQNLQAIQDPDTQEIHTDPVKLQECVHKFFQAMANPTSSNCKTGAFLPAQAPREYPWQCGPDKGMDGFDLETKVGSTGDKNVSVEEHIRDHSLFQEIVRHLSNNWAPGPDEVNNELLKHLPPSMHQAIHKLFVLMWLTGTTPDSWKESNTILLHKKNSELLLENYRPIALANTMYKLWTSLIQESLGPLWKPNLLKPLRSPLKPLVTASRAIVM